MKYVINTDGGARGNPGKAAAAFIIKDSDGKKIKQEGIFLGQATNNEAEYIAIVKALEYLTQSKLPHDNSKIEVRSDSQLVVRQLSNEWKIKDLRMKDFYCCIKRLEQEIGKISYIHIPRTENREADLMVNITLDNLPSYL